MRCERGSEIIWEERWESRSAYFQQTDKSITCFLCMYEGVLDAF